MASSQEDYEGIHHSNNVFAIKLLRDLSVKNENVFISSFSVFSNLNLLASGAGRVTGDEIVKALQMSNSSEQFAKAIKDEYKSFEKNRAISMENSIWLDSERHVEVNFIENARENFNCDVKRTDFSQRSLALKAINGWANEKTSKRVNQLLTENEIDKNGLFITTSTSYLESNWANRFDPDRTFLNNFITNSGDGVRTPFMRQDGQFNMFYDEHFRIIELPYFGEDLSLYVLMPPRDLTISEALDRLSPESVERILNTENKQYISLEMPKLRFEFKANLNLTLQNLGINEAFSDSADFSKIGKNIKLNLFIHHALLNLDEGGAESSDTTIYVRPSVRWTFQVNRPFVFFLVEKAQKNILFSGVINQPMYQLN